MGSGADYNRDEVRQARKDGAQVVKNSGRGQRKGDARFYDILIDYKFTDKGSFSVNKKAYAKHARDSFREGYIPAIVVVFQETGEEYAVVEWSELKEMRRELEEYRERELDG